MSKIKFLLLIVCFTYKLFWRSFYSPKKKRNSEKYQLPLLLIHGKSGGTALLSKQRARLGYGSVKWHMENWSPELRAAVCKQQSRCIPGKSCAAAWLVHWTALAVPLALQRCRSRLFSLACEDKHSLLPWAGWSITPAPSWWEITRCESAGKCSVIRGGTCLAPVHAGTRSQCCQSPGNSRGTNPEES